jgi:hypothetical protein
LKAETAPHRTQLEQLKDATLAYNAKVLELKTMTKPTLIIIYFRVSGTSQLNGESFEMQKWDILNLITLLDWFDVEVRYVSEVSSGGSDEGAQPRLRRILETWLPGHLLICRSPDRCRGRRLCFSVVQR